MAVFSKHSIKLGGAFLAGFIAAAILTLSLGDEKKELPKSRDTLKSTYPSVSEFSNSLLSKPNVFICKGPQSKAYHYNKDCHGLKRCSTKIFEISFQDAIEVGRKVCGFEK